MSKCLSEPDLSSERGGFCFRFCCSGDLRVPQKIKNRTTMWSSKSTPNIYPKKMTAQLQRGMLWLLLLSHFSRVWLCATPQTAAPQAPPSPGFSRQERWSGLPYPSPMHESEKWKWSHSVMSDSSWLHELQPTRLLCPWDSPGKSTGAGCHCLLCQRGIHTPDTHPCVHCTIIYDNQDREATQV